MSKLGGAVSSSSMISLQRSMHSSQMYTPGPAISFLTCLWDLPQKLQRSCSLESVGRAIRFLLTGYGQCAPGRSTPPYNPKRSRSVLRNDAVDDSVVLCLLGAHEVITLCVLAYLV